MDSLDLKYAKSVLLRIADRGAVKKSDLFDVVKSHQVLDNLLGALMKDEYLKIEENERGPRRYSISLTTKGLAVAKQLKKTEDISVGREIFEFLSDDMKLLISLLRGNETRFKSLAGRFNNAYSSISWLKQMKLIDVRIDNNKYPSEEIVSLTDKGRKVAQKLKEIEEILEGEEK